MRALAIKAGWCIAALLFSVQTQAGTYYFHNDHLGTPQVLTDDTQAVVWKGEYDPFGQVTETISTVEQNLRFPGQYYDLETGLHYNYFRTYDSKIGRYVESDTIGILREYDKLLFSMTGLPNRQERSGLNNLYAYTGGNPIVYSDDYGLAESTDHLIYGPSTNCACVIDCVDTVSVGGAVGDLARGKLCGKASIPVIGGIICNIVIYSACAGYCSGKCDLTCSIGRN